MARSDEASQRLMYGCSEDELIASWWSARSWHRAGTMTVISMLSGVQEMIARGLNENARQAINRVKFCIDEYLADKPSATAAAESLLREAVEAWPQFDGDDPVSGADLVEWFDGWRRRAKQALNHPA
jgi:hypothetical protein